MPLRIDEPSSQDLLTEMVREAIGSQQSLAGQRGYSRIYAAFFARILEFIRTPLRAKKSTEARRQKENADKF